MEKRLTWDKYFLALTKITASRSTCLSRRYGAIIVKDKQILSTGFNGSLPGEKHCSEINLCQKRDLYNNQYDLCASPHAETNAILLAAKIGISIKDSTIYQSVTPCYMCFKNIIMSGIKRIVCEGVYNPNFPGYNNIFEKMKKQIKIDIIKLNEDDLREINFYINLDSMHKLIDERNK